MLPASSNINRWRPVETKWGTGSYHHLWYQCCLKTTYAVVHLSCTLHQKRLQDEFCSWVIFVAVAWAAVQSLRKSKTTILFSLLSTKQISLLTPNLHLSWWYWRHISIWMQNFLQQRLPVEFLLPLENLISLKLSMQNTLTPHVLPWIVSHWLD